MNGKLIACLGDGSSGRTKLAGSAVRPMYLKQMRITSTSIYVLAGEVVIADSRLLLLLRMTTRYFKSLPNTFPYFRASRRFLP